jgi:hypothetical protein
MLSGGFDVVIGNPPYIARKKVTQYSFSGFSTNDCPDIYAPCVERSASVLHTDGMLSMIVPISSQFSQDFRELRQFLAGQFGSKWVSSFSRRPSSLFDAGVRPSIYVLGNKKSTGLWSGATYRWRSEFRPHLFPSIRFSLIDSSLNDKPWPRRGNKSITALFDALIEQGGELSDSSTRSGVSVGFKSTALYFVSVFLNDPPAWTLDGQPTPQTKISYLYFKNRDDALIASAVLSGRLSTVWWYLTGDDFDVTKSGLLSFPISLSQLEICKKELLTLSKELDKQLLGLPLVTKKAGFYVGNYRFPAARQTTDKIDLRVLGALGLEEHWPAVLLLDAMLNKTTGGSPDELTKWPFPL